MRYQATRPDDGVLSERLKALAQERRRFGYVCMEIMRQAPQRVARLALLDTSARPDTPEQSDRRRAMLAQARHGDFAAWVEEALTSIMHPSRHADAGLRALNRTL